jgi:membrane protease YdiL (CAAX protease family)
MTFSQPDPIQPDLTPLESGPLASAPTPIEPPPSSVLFGRFGLRAGWSTLIFVTLFVLFSIVLIVTALGIAGKLPQTIADMSHPANVTQPRPIPDVRSLDIFMADILQFSGLVLAGLALGHIESRRFSFYGIGRNRIVDILPGAFWGLATLSLLVAILRATHLLAFDMQALHGSAIYSFGIKWLLAFLAVGLFEEYLSRGFLQFTLTRGVFGLAEKISTTHARPIAFTIAAFFMSLFFSAGHLHNARENPMGIVMTFLAAVVFSYALWRTGSLWWAIGFHMAWDWAQSFLYGVPDSGQISAGRLFHTHPAGNPLLSGGIDGPEGSVYVIPIMLLAALIIRFTTRPGPQPPLEPDFDSASMPAPPSL